MALYEEIGREFIEKAITEFYRRAFSDGIIGHFFFNKDQGHLVQMQTAFAISALGGPKNYTGKSIIEAHRRLHIRKPHFNRRQILMAEVLAELGLREDLKKRWLDIEESLRPLIMDTPKRPTQ